MLAAKTGSTDPVSQRLLGGADARRSRFRRRSTPRWRRLDPRRKKASSRWRLPASSSRSPHAAAGAVPRHFGLSPTTGGCPPARWSSTTRPTTRSTSSSPRRRRARRHFRSFGRCRSEPSPRRHGAASGRRAGAELPGAQTRRPRRATQGRAPAPHRAPAQDAR